ncbi:hypothetical protein [Abditibacterium utsteinense]|uniref:hypothetical protein n=1 Tax=Abditibacterium utsteinense TaxID=1960156 RepID=UPI000F4781DD|nr:hypothetical protein [Abditibacterium utsteinense]
MCSQANYGALAGVISTMTWIYFASLIILTGAETGAPLEDLQTHKKSQGFSL